MSELKTFALFSELVYEPDAGESRLPAGWVRLETSERAGIPTTAAYFGAAYRKIATGDIVIAHRGTELFSLADWGPNTLTVAAGRIPSQFEHARRFDELVRDRFLSDAQSKPITQVGHSLGGGLAAMVAVANRQAGARILDRAFTFNPIGVATPLRQAGFSTAGDLPYVRNVSSWFDPAQAVGTRVGITEQVHVPLIAGMPAVIEAAVAALGVRLAVALGRMGGAALPAYLFHQHSIVRMRRTIDALPASRIQQLAPDLALTNDWNLTGSLASYLQPLQDLAARDPGFASVLQNTDFENPRDAGAVLVQEQSNDLTKRWSYAGTSGADLQIGGLGPDALSGGGGADVQYAGAGADSLTGGAGADWLLGGVGADTYVLSAGDGEDRIVDAGRNYLLRDGRLIAGLFVQDAHSGAYLFVGDPSVTLTFNSPATIAFGGGDSVTLVNQSDAASFSQGGFGIRLVSDPVAPAASATTREITGDLAPVDFDPATPGVQTQADDLGNLVTAGASPDREDTLADSPGNDRIVAGGGDDTVNATQGGADRIEAGAGDDTVFAGAGADWIDGGAGGDQIEAGEGNDFASGGSGRDVVVGGEGGDWIEGGSEGDILIGNAGDDALFAGSGRDGNGQALGIGQLIAAGETGEQAAGPGDVLSGDAGEDFVFGAATADLLAGGEGADVMVGGAGDDTLYGDASVTGAALDWTVTRTVTVVNGVTEYGIAHSNIALAEFPSVGSADTVYGGAGADWIFAGAGDDYAEGGNTADDANVTDDVLFGQAGSDILIGGSAKDFLHGDSASIDLAGLSGDDYLDGGAGDDELLGGKGDALLLGGEGDDTLIGHEGNDLLWGGPGLDILLGGAGKDSYVFNRGDGLEVIQDLPEDPSGADASVLVLGEGIGRDDVKFRIASLMIDLGQGDAIHFNGFDPNNPLSSPVLDSIQFADGSSMSYQDVLDLGFDLDGTEGDDLIVGTAVSASRSGAANIADRKSLGGRLFESFQKQARLATTGRC